ncbi:hypothetical protein BGX38DRAFT_1215883 [Terfezia claveryi]|nr:hypothetical protein BGX38DRAFT_1215883 [Terfezia claveryi]
MYPSIVQTLALTLSIPRTSATFQSRICLPTPRKRLQHSKPNNSVYNILRHLAFPPHQLARITAFPTDGMGRGGGGYYWLGEGLVGAWSRKKGLFLYH